MNGKHPHSFDSWFPDSLSYHDLDVVLTRPRPKPGFYYQQLIFRELDGSRVATIGREKRKPIFPSVNAPRTNDLSECRTALSHPSIEWIADGCLYLAIPCVHNVSAWGLI